MFFGFDAFSVEGHLVFDALFRFSPLYFDRRDRERLLGQGVRRSASAACISAARSKGPTPWRVRGSASIELLFFDISVDVDVTFGEQRR